MAFAACSGVRAVARTSAAEIWDQYGITGPNGRKKGLPEREKPQIRKPFKTVALVRSATSPRPSITASRSKSGVDLPCIALYRRIFLRSRWENRWEISRPKRGTGPAVPLVHYTAPGEDRQSALVSAIWPANRHAILTHHRRPILTHLLTPNGRSAEWVTVRRRLCAQEGHTCRPIRRMPTVGQYSVRIHDPAGVPPQCKPLSRSIRRPPGPTEAL